jgi:hypothetical protein
VALLGDYLVSLTHFIAADESASLKKKTLNRLRILFVVSDVLHADKYHRQVSSADDEVTSGTLEAKDALPRAEGDDSFDGKVGHGLELYLAQLVSLTAIGLTKRDTVLETQLKGLLKFWESSKVLTPHHIKSVQEAANRALDQAQGRRGLYTLPTWFGAQNTAWHDLPASYMLESMVRNPDRAIDPRDLKSTRFHKTEPSRAVCDLLDDYFEKIDLQFAPNANNPTGGTEKYNLWLDPMGQMVKESKETGERKTVCNGWGWSMKMCEDMQKHSVPERILKLRNDHENLLAISREEDYASKRPTSRSSYSSYRSRRSSSSSYDNRPRPQRRRSSHDYDRNYDDRRRKSEDTMDVDRPQAPPNRFDRGSAKPQLNAPPIGNLAANFPPPPPSANYGQGYPAPPPPPSHTAPGFQSPFPMQPQAPGQFTGQPAMHQYPPPPPFPPSHPHPGHAQFQPGPPQFPPGSGGPAPGMYAPQQFNVPPPGYGNNVGFNNNAYGGNNGYGNGNAYGRGGFGNNRGGNGGNGYGQPQPYGQQPQQPQWNQQGPPQRGGYGGPAPNRGNRGNQRGPSRY